MLRRAGSPTYLVAPVAVVMTVAVLVATASAQPAPVVSVSSTSSDDAIAQAALLTIDDFPPGWQETPSSSSSTEPDFAKYGKSCARLQVAANAAKKRRVAHERS